MRLLLPLAACGLAAGTAHADAPPDRAVATYALVVGSNAGGPGQTDLKFAEDDARRVAGLLTELGGYTADTVDVIVHPTPDQLRDRLVKLSTRVNADLAAGRQSRVFFYYSGHARATALDLGNQQMPLAELRTRLFSVPAALTVVVLDACQSGAFSRVKGAAPAADFSFNSRNQLDATGIAVLASSSGSELSQESETLRSSYFTHHLLVGMRGAGDTNKDGQVSIDEAYRYAYHQTLLATAETAVGGQHVSLEVDLKGHGEVPMSFPRAATSSIELPAALEGKTLVEDRRAKAVVAETYKAKGASVRIAVAPGDYQVLVRSGTRLARCQVIAGPGGATVDLARCTSEAIVGTTTKGPGVPAFVPQQTIELLLFAGPERTDGYTDTLMNFGYAEQGLFPMNRGLGALYLRQLSKQLWVGGAGSYEVSPEWKRVDSDTSLATDWSTTRALAIGRAVQMAGESGFLSTFGVYAQVGAGIAVARSHFKDADDHWTNETDVGLALTGGAGLKLESPWLEGWGGTIGYELAFSPSLKNDIGDRHASGGHRLQFSFGVTF
ncbi:MAG: caspase family protein [Deltaproteobacteria bacterium]|nr:caspase family protein [Deltaproteobacteria bacterium]